jgi:hypothetical protein
LTVCRTEGPTKKQQKKLEGITDLAEFQTLAERLRDADSWAGLLDKA